MKQLNSYAKHILNWPEKKITTQIHIEINFKFIHFRIYYNETLLLYKLFGMSYLD